MKQPSGHMVELDFYFNDRSSADALRDVVEHCIAAGSTLSGDALVSEFEGARNAIFPHVHCHDNRVITLPDAEMHARLCDNNTRVLKIGLWNTLGFSDNSPEIVMFNGMSEVASSQPAQHRDHHRA